MQLNSPFIASRPHHKDVSSLIPTTALKTISSAMKNKPLIFILLLAVGSLSLAVPDARLVFDQVESRTQQWQRFESS
jgi:hypothetical protein